MADEEKTEIDHHSDADEKIPADEETDAIDYFEFLPEDLIHKIFSLIGDAEVLGRCLLVSRRFKSFAQIVPAVTVRADFIQPTWSLTRRRVLNTPLLPVNSKVFLLDRVTSYSPFQRISMHQVLTNFKKIKRLHLELPVSEINVLDGGGLILKWKVEIQSSADRFAIFTATESSNPDDPYPIGLDLEAYGNDRKWKGEAWFFTALAAAWARNHCLSKIVADYPALETILVTDANGQGVLALDLKQGPNVFKNSLTTWLTSKDITVWILPKLKLPGGMVLDEPILIARDTSTADTVDLSIRNGDNHWILNSFEEPFRTAVNMMMQSELLFIEEL